MFSSISSVEKSDINPVLLFQTMMTIATFGHMHHAYVLNYELCTYQPALFKSRTLLTKTGPQLTYATQW